MIVVPVGHSAPRRIADVALIVALLGGALPAGLHDPTSYGLNAYELVLTVLAGVALVGVVLDLARPQPLAWPFMLAAGVWAAASVYGAFLPGAVWIWRAAIACIFGGFALLAAGMWRYTVVVEQRAERR